MEKIDLRINIPEKQIVGFHIVFVPPHDISSSVIRIPNTFIRNCEHTILNEVSKMPANRPATKILLDGGDPAERNASKSI